MSLVDSSRVKLRRQVKFHQRKYWLLVRVLLADFPMSGLTTVSQLAKRCGVSDPSVLRLVKKLGFSGYPEFQSTLVQKIDERMRSP
ncbi:MAG TPA: hypothetical protein DCR64_10935, partial [Vibrio sp.]|nr:hypothetical protein [Vibrio sp.]